jgi:hypothetical protein
VVATRVKAKSHCEKVRLAFQAIVSPLLLILKPVWAQSPNGYPGEKIMNIDALSVQRDNEPWLAPELIP